MFSLFEKPKTAYKIAKDCNYKNQQNCTNACRYLKDEGLINSKKTDGAIYKLDYRKIAKSIYNHNEEFSMEDIIEYLKSDMPLQWSKGKWGGPKKWKRGDYKKFIDFSRDTVPQIDSDFQESYTP